MQLVFECSYHTNVDRLHFQSCVPAFCQYSIIVFISPFSIVCPQPSGSVCSSLFFSILHIFWRQMSVFACKVMDNMENKTVLL